jgi:tetratricopeptide (TPR) repeat protein
MNPGLFALMLMTAPSPDVTEVEARADAWDRSVARETAGDLPGAEAIMVRAWGGEPENYWAGLRLAYLALLQSRPDEAYDRYQALRQRPEAQGDTDVVRGLASAVAGKGWHLASLGEADRARAEFRRALSIDPDNASAKRGLATIASAPLVSPELWTGLVGYSLGMYRYQGFALYGDLPVSIGRGFVLRAAGRYMAAGRSARSVWAFGGRGNSSWTLDEEYLSLARAGGLVAGEIVGARSSTTGQATLWGGAARLRVGTFAGGLVEASYLRAAELATNAQVVPLLYYWPIEHVGLQAGARVTLDDRGNSVSATAGISLLARPFGLHLRGHAGDERWAFALDAPSIASFDAVTSYGGSATILWSVSSSWRLGLQGEGERLRAEGALGYYWCISAGLQYQLGGS